MLALIVILLLAWAATLNRNFQEQIADDVFFSLTLASCALVFRAVRPLSEILQLVGVALVLNAVQQFVLKTPPRILPALALVGVSSLLLLALRGIWSVEERQLLQDSVVPPLLLVLLGYFGSVPLAITDRLHPKTLDLVLYSFDQSLGLQLSFKVGQIVMASPILDRTTLAVYYALPLVMMFVYARLLLHDRRLAMTAFLAFVITGPLGIVFYNLIPACGPGYLVGSRFPFDPLPVQQLTHWPLAALPVPGPRNAFPSLHLAWALLVWWYSEGLSVKTRIIFALFVVGTIIATLGLGEHYFVDLVTAFPFALIILAACALNMPVSNARRLVPLLTGLLLMLGWVILLRRGLPLVWANPLIPWALVVGTIGLGLFLQKQLRR